MVKRRQGAGAAARAHAKITGCDPGDPAGPLAPRSRQAARTAFEVELDDRRLPVPAPSRARRPRPHRPLRPRQDAAPQAPRDRGARWPRRSPRRPACGGPRSRGAATSTSSSTAGRSPRAARGASPVGAAPAPRTAGPRDRRAHDDQPEQGRPHRPPAQRLPRRHVRAPAAPPRLRRRRAELHRRHRRAGRGRGGRASSTSRGRRSPTSRRSAAGSTTTAGTSTRGSATSTPPTPRERRCRPRPSTRSRRAATTPPGSPSTWRARIVDCHLATMARLGIGYDLLAHESDILRLHFWNRAFELLQGEGRDPPRDRGQERGLLGAADGRGRRGGIDEDKIIVRSNGTVTYTGKDIAYQLWKLGKLDRDFRYRPLPDRAPTGTLLWTTTSGEGEAGAPRFGHAEAVYNVIDVGQSYPQRVVKAGVAALGHAEAAEGSHHLAYEKVVLSPATARALGYAVSEEETRGQGLGPQGPRRQGRRPPRRAGGEGARRGRRARPRARRRRRARRRPTPSPPARCATS